MNRNVFWSLVVAVVGLAGCSREPEFSTTSADALRVYRQGVTHLDLFYYAEATSSFDSAIAADPSFALPWVRKAQIAAMSGDERSSLEAIGEAVARMAHTTRREALLIRMWDHRLHYRLQEAAATAESLIALAPKTAEAYQFRGQLMEYDKNYEGAIKWYERAVEADSTFGQAVMSLGYAHSGIGDHEQAIRYMERYIRLAPDAADPRSSLADLFVRVGRYEDALTQYQASLKLKPDYWYAVREIGTVYLALGRLREAREQFHASLGLLPKNRVLDAARCIADARVNLGRRDYEAAAEGFREALRLDSLSNQAAFGLAYAEGKRGHFKDAEQVATRIREEVQRRHLEGSAVMAGVLVMESRLRMEEGALEEALALCDSALATSNPLGRGEVFRQLAEIQLRRHEYEGALAACEEALRIAPNSIENLLTLLRVYGAAGDRRMTAEIGGRLLNLWKNADPDFGALREVQAVLRTRGTEREKQNGVEGSR